MSAETPITSEEITQIASNRNYNHPVANLLRDQMPSLQIDLKNSTGLVPERLLALADQMEDLELFNLSARDMVGIWAEVTYVGGFGHTFGGIIPAAFAVQEAPNQNWHRFARYFIGSGQIPTNLSSDEQGLKHIHTRLESVSNQLSILELADNEPTLNPTKILRNELINRSARGDQQARQEFLDLMSDQHKRAPLIVEIISDDLGNGMVPLLYRTRKALKALAPTELSLEQMLKQRLEELGKNQ